MAQDPSKKIGPYAYANNVTGTYRYEHTPFMAICHSLARCQLVVGR